MMNESDLIQKKKEEVEEKLSSLVDIKKREEQAIR